MAGDTEATAEGTLQAIPAEQGTRVERFMVELPGTSGIAADQLLMPGLHPSEPLI